MSDPTEPSSPSEDHQTRFPLSTWDSIQEPTPVRRPWQQGSSPSNRPDPTLVDPLDAPTIPDSDADASLADGGAATSSWHRPEPQGGQILGARYELKHLLARRSTSGRLASTTWRAQDLTLSRRVLMHILDPDDHKSLIVLAAARKAASIDDGRFLRVLDAMEASGQEPYSFIVCEYAPGRSLRQLLVRGPLSNAEAAFVAHEVASALDVAHAAGVQHLRLTPDSIIVTASGNIKIAGLLVEAALDDRPELRLSQTERTDVDLRALGRVLYASLTGFWPIDATSGDTDTYGLQAAPLRTSGSHRTWELPRALRTDAHPALEQIALSLMSRGTSSANFGSADKCVGALAKVIANTEPQEALESRVRRFIDDPEREQQTAVLATSTMPAVRTDDLGTAVLPAVPGTDGPAAGTVSQADEVAQTRPMAAVTDGPTEPANRTPFVQNASHPEPAAHENPTSAASQVPDDDTATQIVTPDAVSGPETLEQPATTARTDRSSPVAPGSRPVKAAPSRAELKRREKLRQRRNLAIILSFILLALIALQLRGCSGRNGGTGPVSPTSTGPQALTIAAAADFDPVSDGGERSENPDQVKFAHDGDPATVWKTLTYFNNPNFGGLKSGAGVVFDLGKASDVSAVHLLLDNEPTSVKIMIPADNPNGDSAPAETVKQWRTIAGNESAGKDVTLETEAVNTRWVLVYFDKLPPIQTDRYRSGICEATILG